MEHDHSKAAILELLLKDLEYLEDRQKGKETAGRYTDLALAIDCMKKDVLSSQISIRDEILAHSTSVAVASDMNLLSSIQHQERVADQDHQLALALNHGRAIPARDPSLTGKYDPASIDENDDAVSVAMRDLMTRVTLKEESDYGEGSSRAASFHRPAAPRTVCVSCLENCEAILFVGQCGHEFCLDCTRQMFLGSIKDEELYPPRCCGNVVPPGVALRVLNYQELRDFSERALEWTAKDRVYCADPNCSKFIPPFAIKDDHGTCPQCRQQTHLPCRSLMHRGVDCPMDENLPVVLEMAERRGWKRCSRCRTMVELRQGCNHITCRCGREFCYVCTATWKTCGCDLWYEERLVDMAHQVVEEEAPRDAGDVVLRRMFDQAIEGLLQHENVGCEHHRSSQWAWRNRGRLQCDICYHYLPEYIFMCKNCRMRACWDCRRHRLR